MATVGQQGEELVGAWLQTKNAQVLHYRWRSRRSEIDLIAQKDDGTVLFIEVKTRSKSNWDADGLMAIDRRKQSKIIHGAQMFLGLHPNLADQPCRFDVALVSRSTLALLPTPALHSIQLESGDYLHLSKYLVSAFEGDL
jgi:putative endonuclease